MTTTFEFITSPDQISGDFFLELYQFDHNYFPTPWSIDGLKTFFASHQFLLVVIKSDLTMVGYSLFDVQNADSFAHLLKIIIKVEMRGKHFGEQLISESIKY